jgi:hypothetical protein
MGRSVLCSYARRTVEVSENANTKKSSPAMILAAWVLVGVPLAWGVYNTLLNSMKLFQAPAASTATPASGAPTK